jgi:hypothetical protein
MSAFAKRWVQEPAQWHRVRCSFCGRNGRRVRFLVKTLPLRNEAALNCAALRFVLMRNCERSGNTVKGRDERPCGRL